MSHGVMAPWYHGSVPPDRTGGPTQGDAMHEDAHLEAAYEDRVSGDVDVDEYEPPGPDCTVCGDEITGAIWGPYMRCLACHEAAMLPPESGADYMPGWGDE